MQNVFDNASLFLENIVFTPYFRIGFFIFSVFLIIAMIGMVRKHYFKLTMRGANFGFLLGIIFVLVLEAAILIAILYGFKAFDIFTGKKKPNEVVELTRAGAHRIINVLGINTSATSSATFFLEQLPQLSKDDEDKIKAIICR